MASQKRGIPWIDLNESSNQEFLQWKCMEDTFDVVDCGELSAEEKLSEFGGEFGDEDDYSGERGLYLTAL